MLYRFSFVFAFVFLFLTPFVAQATTLPTDAYLVGTTTWTKADSPYVLTGLVTLPYGSSLIIEPGTIVKMNGHVFFYLYGTATVGGATGTEPVTITSIKDDTVGGDTNSDGGATLPAPGDWFALFFLDYSEGTFRNTIIRYGGFPNGPTMPTGAILNQGGTITITDSAITDSKDANIRQYYGSITVTRSEIARANYGLFLHQGSMSIHDSHIHDHTLFGAYNQLPLIPTIVDAKNNWWGSGTGPYHPTLNPSGLGDSVFEQVDFAPWLASDPADPLPPPCTIDCNSNVLFLPGLQASRLYRPNLDHSCDYTVDGVLVVPSECRLWEPGGDVLSQYIGLNEGVSTWDDVYTRDVIENAYGNANIYASFITRMNTMKESGVIKDWGSAPYDWRLSLNDILDYGHSLNGNIHYSGIHRATTTPFVIQELRRLAANSKTGRVTIIAHSNGGLVTKALLARLGDVEAASLVDTIILVASPQTGTPQAIGALLHGFKQDIPGDVWYLPDGTFFSARAARILAHDMPGAYQLLPSVQYFHDVQTPVATFANSTPILTAAYDRYGSMLNTSDELADFVLGNEGGRVMPSVNDLVTPNMGSSLLLENARVGHAFIDSWHAPEEIRVIQIAGWGVDTVSGIEYTQKRQGNDYEWKYRPILREDGDGTVVVPSALAMPSAENVERLWLDLDTYNIPLVRHADHSSILEVQNLLDFIENTIAKTLTPLSEYTYLSTSTPPSTSNKKLHYFLHSPLALNLYDDHGNHTGIATSTGVIENHIPGAYYREFGEVKYITAPASTSLHLVLNGQASGTFSLDIHEVDGNVITATTTFENISSGTTTKVSMDFFDGTIAGASPLSIDQDGDGTTDFSLLPKVGETITLPTDTTAPEALISFSTSTNAIIVTGVDDSTLPVISSSTTTYPAKKKNSKEHKGVATTTVTLTDAAGNSTLLTYTEMLPSPDQKDAITLVSLHYNGVVSSSSATLKYKWDTNTNGDYKLFATYIATSTMIIESHYRPKKDITVVLLKPVNEGQDDDTRSIKTTLPGMVIPRLLTEKGKITITY